MAKKDKKITAPETIDKKRPAPETTNSNPTNPESQVLNCLSHDTSPPPTPVNTLHASSILTLAKFFSRKECLALQNFIDTSPERSTTRQKATSEYTFRHNDRIQFDSLEIANLISSRIKAHPCYSDVLENIHVTDIDVNPNIRLYRYLPSMRFGPHYDESNVTSNGKTTRWTILIYLNSVEGGGETNFWLDHDASNHDQANFLRVPPVEGTMLLHLHGDDCLLHEGAEVTAGIKYLFRTDLCF
ncbi:hypothetical protein TrLO_g14400 [Triparma laevis f. longispina]|uniref:Fe2OG dioxygenase domain-containing protein n=1 Tax=Triparma laevis f. longispina TaxID=1714387 RepID=A0A9W7DNI7_9STRA|nr:hypothetical protein TrLO_g14400 [Triparma laevis f. longispina]